MSDVRRTKTVRLQVPANKAKPSPQIGQALGQLEEFNGLTTKWNDDTPLRVILYAFSDGTYKFTIHPPVTSWFIKRAVGVAKASAFPKTQYVGSIHAKQLYELAVIKKKFDPNPYMKNVSLLAIVRQMVGQCSTMGVRVDTSRTDTTTTQTEKS